jgi:4-hydroxy-4-methyl-2-oxoglutarate aldolase
VSGDGATQASALREFGSSTALEASQGRAAWVRGARALWSPVGLAGPAFTIEAPPGDNLAFHRALADCPPDVVLAAATGGATEAAVWGEVLTVAAVERGVLGLVTDGAVRDCRRIRELGFPVFAAGTSPVGAAKGHPGELGTRVRLGGADIAPGDWLVADEDGVVVVPAEALEETLGAATERRRVEDGWIERLRSGELTVDLLGLRGRSTTERS